MMKLEEMGFQKNGSFRSSSSDRLSSPRELPLSCIRWTQNPNFGKEVEEWREGVVLYWPILVDYYLRRQSRDREREQRDRKWWNIEESFVVCFFMYVLCCVTHYVSQWVQTQITKQGLQKWKAWCSGSISLWNSFGFF